MVERRRVWAHVNGDGDQTGGYQYTRLPADTTIHFYANGEWGTDPTALGWGNLVELDEADFPDLDYPGDE